MRFQEVFSWSVLLVFIVNSVNVSMKKYNNIEYIVVDMTDNHAHPEWLPIAIIPVNSFHGIITSSFLLGIIFFSFFIKLLLF